MGANGSKSSGILEDESGRRWKTVEELPNGVKIIELKDSKTPTKMPEESHSPNAIYGMMFKKVTMFADANDKVRRVRHRSRGLRAPCREAPPRCFS